MNVALLVYVIGINSITFITFGLDKYKSMHNHWRIPELTLLTLSFIGGALGGYVAMHAFGHKTRKPLFVYGMPLLIALQLLVYLYYYIYIYDRIL